MAGNINFTEQIKAMGVIERIYSENIAKEKFLNYSALRQKMFNEIKEYYRINNTEITDNVIQEGVDVWLKENYLNIQKPKNISIFTLLLSYLFIKRKIFFFIIITALLMYYSLTGFVTFMANKHTEELKKQLLSLSLEANQSKIDNLENRLEKIKNAKTNYLNNLVMNSYINEAQVEIDKYKSLLLSSTLINQSNNEELENFKKTNKNNLETMISNIIYNISTLENLIEKDKELQNLNIEKIDNPTIKQELAFIISKMTPNNINEVDKNIFILKNKLEFYNQLNEITKVVDEKIKYFDSLPLNPDESEIIKNIITRIKLSTDNLNKDDLESNLKMLDYYYELSKVKLNLNIVDKTGVNSGLYRYYNNNQNIKTYYLVVQATDDNNKSYPLYITSVEDGRTVQKNMFAIKVTENKYEEVKKDKLSDGIINDRFVGIKKVGHIKFNYIPNVSESFIYNW